MAFFRCVPPSPGGGGGGADDYYVSVNNNGVIEYPPLISTVTTGDGLFYQAKDFNMPVKFGNRWAGYPQAFYCCYNFNSPVEIEPFDWNYALNGAGNTKRNMTVYNRGLSFASMFHSCQNFNLPMDLNNYIGISNYASMFFSCYKFNQPMYVPVEFTNNEILNVVSITAASMFASCRELNSRIVIKNVDGGSPRGTTRLMYTLTGLFQLSYNFNQPFYIDARNVNNVMADNMFQNCNHMKQPLLFEFHNIRNIVAMRNMFLNAKSYPTDIVFNFTNVPEWNVQRFFNNAYYPTTAGLNYRVNIYTSDVESFKTFPWIAMASESWYAVTNGYRLGTSGNIYLLNNVSDGVNKFWEYYNNFYNIT